MTTTSNRRLWIVYYAYLLSSIPVFSWYDRTVLRAVLNPSSDTAGNIVFSSNSTGIYPFTIASAALSAIITVVIIWRRVRGVLGLLTGVLVARASIGATMELYELTFVSVGYLFHGWRTLEEHFLPNIDWTLLKLGYISTLVPWIRRESVKTLLVLAIATLLVFFVWAVSGYELPSSGEVVSYALNAVTRFLVSLMPVFALMGHRIFSRGKRHREDPRP
jgi:cadmium resistance protein CadD (predicted permease)